MARAVTAVSFAAMAPNLSLTIAAESCDYVGYGQVLNWTRWCLANTGTGSRNSASIALTLPPQIDANAATWTCTAWRQRRAQSRGQWAQDNAVVLLAAHAGAAGDGAGAGECDGGDAAATVKWSAGGGWRMRATAWCWC